MWQRTIGCKSHKVWRNNRKRVGYAARMGAPRFFIAPADAAGLAAGSHVALPVAVAHHARRVLRLRPDDPIVLFDGSGREYAAVLVDDPRGVAAAAARIVDAAAVDREAHVRITLVQALSAQDKIDWLIEKCVELGVARLVLAPAERSVVRLEPARRERRLERWRDIALAACSQCGRNRLLDIAHAPALAPALALAADAGAGARWLLDPYAGDGLLAAAPAAPGTAIACVVGPEGGLTDDEIRQAEQLGYRRAHLGRRILRTETAGLAAVCALLAQHGEYA